MPKAALKQVNDRYTSDASVLHETEEVAIVVRPKWTILLPSLGASFGVVVLLLVPIKGIDSVAHPLLLIGLVMALAVFAGGLVARRHDRFLVTNERLIHIWGLLNTRVREVSLIDVSDTTVEQNFLERLIGAGSLRVDISSGPPEILQHIPNPVHVQEVLSQEIEKIMLMMYARPDAVKTNAPEDVIGELERLFVLEESGAVTQQEFQAAKRRLMKHL